MNKFCYRVVLIMIFAFLILPILSMVIWAFFTNWRSTDILPNSFTLAGFQYFFTSKDWYIGIKSVIFSVEVALIATISSIMVSRFLITINIKAKIALESIFYLPMLLPVISVCLGSHKLFLKSPLSSTFALLILHTYFSLPYAFKMTYSYYTVWGIEEELTARGLGASFWQAFKYINIPIYIKGYIGSFFMAFIISYSQYFINLFIGNNKHVNFSMIMTPYITNSNRNISAAYTLMYIFYGVVVMIFTSLIGKNILRKKS
ncbi:ABC transporter permease subunit [Clostridium bowmanii]|uniref:ABC transporter permease n=1 Tax=Clostridium bowmanii TaxID=132925 RepID=UPI001C0C6CAC|nr:ABC transporter permease subunit [Clostridium bowmanii]MBU3189553.1 ABC transporter permease subunit [Clostridium bowmanii]MCA1073605.1 ABC transporter permease subunit [Clostridium bowmanii]